MATDDSKACTRCGQTKPATCFSRDRRAPTGLQAACKPCTNASRRAHRNANIEAERAKERERHQRNPTRLATNQAWRERNREQLLAGKKRWYESVKNTPEFQAATKARQDANRENKRRYDQRRHIERRSEVVQRAVKWAKDNPDRRKAISFTYSSKRRVKTDGGPSTREVREWAAKQKKRCYWCDEPCPKGYHVDHYVPLAKGGEHAISNFVVSCGPCNLKKNAKDPLEFAQSIGKLL